MKKYIIIPGSSDLNRGDQALAWETKEIAVDAGYIGKYSILAEKDEPVQQSIDEGFNVLRPVLEHPSRHFKDKNNITYTLGIKILWGLVAIKDFLVSLFYLTKVGRIFLTRIFPNSECTRTIKEFEYSDAVFMKGGGLIQSHGGILSTYATYYRVYHLLLAQSLKKRIYIMPNSFGPFEGPFVKSMVKKVFARCNFIAVREEKSNERVMEELGFDFPVYPDLAFFLKESNAQKSVLFDKYSIPADKEIVVITMRPYRFPNSKDPVMSYNKFKIEMAKTIESINKMGMLPMIIEHTHAITSHENDGDSIRNVLELLASNVEYVFISDRSLNCRELKKIYSYCNFIIGTRFHSLIFSLSSHVPGIAISYDGYKSIGIMRDIGLEDYVIDISDVTEKRLIEMLKQVITNQKAISLKIDKYIKKSNVLRQDLINKIK